MDNEMKPKLNLDGMGRLVPAKALLIYKMLGQDVYARTENSAYASMHDIRNDAICEGHPISEKTLLELCQLVMPEIGTTVKYIPPELLSYNPKNKHTGKMVWWKPVSKVNLFFDIKGIRNCAATLPALLFAVAKGDLYIWAIKVNRRPTLETVIYHAPFFNVDNRGRVCTGNIKIPKKVSPADMKVWEDLFFNSTFTSDHEPNLQGITGHKFWQNISKKKNKTSAIPNKHLKRRGTLKEIINLIMGG